MVKWADTKFDVSMLLPPVAPVSSVGDGPGPAVAPAGPCHFLAPIPGGPIGVARRPDRRRRSARRSATAQFLETAYRRRFACAWTMLHALMVRGEIAFRKCGFGLRTACAKRTVASEIQHVT